MDDTMLRRMSLLTTALLALACNREAPAQQTKADPAEKKAAEAKAAEEPEPEAAKPGSRTWTFDDALAGQVPAGFRLEETGSQGKPATWEVVADDSAPTRPHAFGITKSENDKRTYNLAFAEGTSYADLDLSVMVKAVSGELNRGGGPIWRVKDADNYYIARWDPVEDNAYLYVMQGGVRTALAKVDLELDHDAWHSLRVVVEGSHFELLIDDQPVLEADDESLPEAGMVGLWTKSDAATLFDDLSVSKP